MEPASQPALLPPPTTVNNTHRKWDTFIFIVILLVIASAMTIGRLYLRWRSRVFSLDDWAAIPALLFYIGHSIVGAFVNAHAGIGKPLLEVTMPEFELWGKGIVFSCFLYPLASGFIRLSILLLYDRIFSKASRAMKLITRGTMVFVGIYIVAFVIYAGFLCKPLHKFWKPFERAKYCGDNINYWKYNAVIYGVSLLLDLELLVLPIYPVWQLRLALKKRLGAIIMFALGASACVAATYKLVVFGMQWVDPGELDPEWFATAASRVIPPQFAEYGYTMWIPTHAELSAAMMGSSLIALKPYLRMPTQKLSTTFGSLHNPFSPRVSKLSSQRTTESSGQLRSTDKYVRMQDRDQVTVTTEFELRHLDASRV